MEIPSELRYTKEHEWVRVEDGNVAFVGISDFAQGELGDIVFVELQPAGSEIDKDEAFGTVEAVKTVSDLYMPLTGKILEVNADLESNPEFINDDPYGKGWMIKIELTEPSQIDELLTADQYESMVG